MASASRVYLLQGLLVPCFEKTGGERIRPGTWSPETRDSAERLPDHEPKNYTLCVCELGTVRAVFPPGHSGSLAFTVTEPEQARQLALSVLGVLAIWGCRHASFDLVEVRHEPDSSLGDSEFRDLLIGTKGSPCFLSGSGLIRTDLEHLPEGIRKFATDHGLREAVCGLDLSDAFVEMGLGPFEYFLQDIEAMSDAEFDADYLVNRHRYELSFVAAFKGIEALLGGRPFKKHEVASRLATRGIEPESQYEPFVERGGQPMELESALQKSLLRRNVVAAHQNLAAPEKLQKDRITLDVAAEVRILLLTLFRQALGPPIKSELPSEAFLP